MNQIEAKARSPFERRSLLACLAAFALAAVLWAANEYAGAELPPFVLAGVRWLRESIRKRSGGMYLRV